MARINEQGLLSLPLVVAVGAAVAGLYLLLSAAGQGPRTRSRAAGIGLLAAAMIPLTVRLIVPDGWWDSRQGTGLSESGSTAAALLYVAPACAAILAVALMTTATRPATQAVAFVVVVLGNASLLAMHEAAYIAVMTVLVLGGGLALVVLATAGEVDLDFEPGGEPTREPLLACLAGGLLAAALVATLHATTAAPEVESKHARQVLVERLQRHRRTAVPREGAGQAAAGQPAAAATGSSIIRNHGTALFFASALLLTALVGIGAVTQDCRQRRLPP